MESIMSPFPLSQAGFAKKSLPPHPFFSTAWFGNGIPPSPPALSLAPCSSSASDRISPSDRAGSKVKMP